MSIYTSEQLTLVRLYDIVFQPGPAIGRGKLSTAICPLRSPGTEEYLALLEKDVLNMFPSKKNRSISSKNKFQHIFKPYINNHNFSHQGTSENSNRIQIFLKTFPLPVNLRFLVITSLTGWHCIRKQSFFFFLS